ncbi:MAG TPA: rhomboid family intramembrane serine protease [Candidatus Methanoperedens sp.]|nr:rhomboid family intramembrane serine protease [Candidatus Methanoperedens sp.]
MIPLRDTIPTRTFPGVTIALIAANVLVFLYQLSLGPRSGGELVAVFGAVPAQLTGAAPYAAPVLPPALTILTSMFLHGGFAHLLGNMVFLWIFGNNVEDATGHLRFPLFYLACGAAAALAHVATHPGSTVPMVGASGAISGVLGAYFLLYPHARIVTLVFLGFFAQTVQIPAFFFLGFWFLMQFFSGALSIGSGGGVAWFAHVGGFVAGLALLVPFKRRHVRLWSPITD